MLRQGNQALAAQRSQHEESKCHWDSSQGSWITSEGKTEGWFRRCFRNILAQDYIIWWIAQNMLLYANTMPPCQGIKIKCFNHSAKCLMARIMMHSWNAWLQCWCNTMIKCSMHNGMVHMNWCISYDAGPMMHTPWCKDDEAQVLCIYEVHKIWCIHAWVCDAHNTTRVLGPFSRD